VRIKPSLGKRTSIEICNCNARVCWDLGFTYWRRRSGKDNRLFVEAVLWIARTGSPWRDLPASFGHWNSVFTRFRDWVKGDVWKRLFDALSDDPDMEYAMVDATIVKVHRHGQGAKGGLKARPLDARKAA
jgi:transposase